MKKGFTLIELLAVIVILAIIALIATPIVLNIINDTKESALARSAEFYLDAVEYSISMRILSGKTIENGVYNIMESGNICLGTLEDNTCKGEILEVKVDGKVPNGEKITIKDGMVVSHVIKYGDAIIKSDDEYDHNAPELNPINATIVFGYVYHEITGERIGFSGTYRYGDYIYETINYTGNKYGVETIEEGRKIAKEELMIELEQLDMSWDDFITLLAEQGKSEEQFWKEQGLTEDSFEPSSYDGWSVSVIDKNQTSYGAILESINGKNITSLYRTFYECTALTVAPVIPQGVTDMSYAFYGCRALTAAPVIPQGVKYMGDSFWRCDSLKTYVGAPQGTEDGDFSGYVIPNSVTDMSATFLGCNGLIIPPEIPNSVTTMYITFGDCKALTTAPVIPNSVTNMGSTFSGCTSLKTYEGASKGTEDGDFSGYIIPNSVTTMSLTFSRCTGLTTPPVIPHSVTNMYMTFKECTALTIAPVIPSGVTDMNGIFDGCTSLKTYVGALEGTKDGDFSSYIVPNGVTDMSYAFDGCTVLTAAPVIPNSVTDIAYAFRDCTSLSGTITINSTDFVYKGYEGCLKNTQITQVIGECGDPIKAKILATK